MKLLRKIYNTIRLDRPDPSRVPAEYLTRRGTVKDLSGKKVEKLMREDPVLYEYLAPYIKQRVDRRGMAGIVIAIIAILINVSNIAAILIQRLCTGQG